MHVIHLVSNNTWGGGEQYVLDLSRAMVADGHHIEIITRPVSDVIDRFTGCGLSPVAKMPLRGAIDFYICCKTWNPAAPVRRGDCACPQFQGRDCGNPRTRPFRQQQSTHSAYTSSGKSRTHIVNVPRPLLASRRSDIRIRPCPKRIPQQQSAD